MLQAKNEEKVVDSSSSFTKKTVISVEENAGNVVATGTFKMQEIQVQQEEQTGEEELNEEERQEMLELEEKRLSQLKEMQDLMQEYQDKLDQLQKLKEMKLKQEEYAKQQMMTLGDRETELNDLLSMMDMIKKLKAQAGINANDEIDEIEDEEEEDEEYKQDEDKSEEEEDDDDDDDDEEEFEDIIDEQELADLKKDAELEELDKKLEQMAIHQTEIKDQLDSQKEVDVKTKLQEKLLQLNQIQGEVNYYASVLAHEPASASATFKQEPTPTATIDDPVKSALVKAFGILLEEKGAKSFEFFAAFLKLFKKIEKTQVWNEVYSVATKIVETSEESSGKNFMDSVVSYLASIFYLLQEKGVKDLNPPTSTLIKEAFIDVWTQAISEENAEFTLEEEHETELDAIFELYAGKPLPQIKEDLIVNLIEFVGTHSSSC